MIEAVPVNIEIFRFEIDDVNTEKFWVHGLMVEQIEQVLHVRFTVRRNRKNRRAPYIIIGRDFSGQCLTIPIEPTDYEPGTWRPVTAWYCKPSEAAVLPQRR